LKQPKKNPKIYHELRRMELIFFSTSLSYAQFLFTNVDNKIEN
jgi:hypothetical protein